MVQKTLMTFILLFVALLSGCATERHIVPTISGDPRLRLNLETPVLMSVYDGRASEDRIDVTSTMRLDLTRLYNDNIEWIPYFQTTPSGRVSIRIRIVTLGAEFGSRLISSATYTNAVQSAQFSATSPWGTVVGLGSSTSSVFEGSFTGEGWWNGAAWIDIEIEDHRFSQTNKFLVPLAAEYRESNIWGYASGDKAARKAWERVSAQLTRVIDAVLHILRENQSK